MGTSGTEVANGAERNIISGNGAYGVNIQDPGSNLNVVAGNSIGTDVTGALALANGTGGVFTVGLNIGRGAQSNRVGTNGDGVADAAEGNLISGNFGNGVEISDPNTSKNVVAGNYIGTNTAGTAALPNGTRGGNGLQIRNGASFNQIGINPADVIQPLSATSSPAMFGAACASATPARTATRSPETSSARTRPAPWPCPTWATAFASRPGPRTT